VNSEIYDRLVKPIVLSSLEGINGIIFAFGQTGSGKTYSMTGKALGKEQDYGYRQPISSAKKKLG